MRLALLLFLAATLLPAQPDGPPAPEAAEEWIRMARAVAPEFGSDVLLRMVETRLVTDRKQSIELLEEAFDMAGGAIGESVRNLAQPRRSRALSFTGSFIGMLANLAFLYIWWRALRGERKA